MRRPRFASVSVITIILLCGLVCSANALAAPSTPRHRPVNSPAADSLKQDVAMIPARNAAPALDASPAAGTDSGADMGAKEMLKGKDTDENAPLPDYPPNARISIGALKSYVTSEEDTFADIARHFDLGYVELRAANPGVDPWFEVPGEKLTIPSFKLLPRAPQQGIVVNLGEMRMYYFPGGGAMPLTFPLGIGREGLETPIGQTSIIKKVIGPVWFPTDRMRKEKPWLPASIPAGPSNPLGTHAMYLGWPTFLIHGSNKPWGIGRRVSSGCIRMYPEDIITMFGLAPVGLRVTVVNQAIKIGWLDDGLYLEANPTLTQSNQIEVDGTHAIKGMSAGIRHNIETAAGNRAEQVDWSLAEKTIRERRGIPVRILKLESAEKKADTEKFSYN